MKKLKILLLEDNLSDAELIKNALKNTIKTSVEFKRTVTKKEFVQQIKNFKPDLIISDYTLPQYDGLTALADMKQINVDIPFIIVTGTLSEEVAAEAIKSGAWDYVVKERLFRLSSAVQTSLQLKAKRDQIKCTEEELRKSEERFRLISTSAHDAIIMIDEHGDVSFWNPAAEKIFGYSYQEIIGKNLHKLLLPESYMEAYLKAFPLFQKWGIGKAIGKTLELKALRKDGKIIPVELSLARMNHEGKWGAVGIIRDISERKAAEVALRESETRFRTLFEQSQDAIYILYQNRFVRINQRFSEIFGYTFAEVQDENFDFMKIVDDTSKPLIEERMRRYQAGETLEPIFEFTAVAKNGHKADCEVSVTYVDYEDGVAIQCIIRDITSRKQAEGEIRKLFHAVEQSPVSIVITDLDGRIEYVNPKFCEQTGYLKDEVIGKNPNILKSGEHTQPFYKDLWNTILSGKPWYGEMHNRKKDDELFWEEAIIGPIFDDSGNITHFIGFKEDITKRKQLETQLQQSQKLEAIGQLAGGVAHDFNNMLSVILGYSELILINLNPEDKLYGYIQEINKAARRSADLTTQLLAFARKQAITPQALDLNEAVRNMLKMLRRLIGENVDLIWKPGANLETIYVDPAQIDQILANLCVNARDDIDGVGRVTIETENVTIDEDYCQTHAYVKPGNYVMLTVSDDGCGMDQETLTQVFEPFFTTKTIGQGTGLGLSTVYGIIKQNKGLINVYSELAQGTTFKLYFPCYKGVVQTEQAEKEIEIELPVGHGQHILLVEDEAAILELTQSMLEGIGYSVIAINTPQEALSLAQEQRDKIELLITDVMMPRMNGKELANRLHAFYPEMKVLFISGYTSNVIAHRGVLDKGINFIKKPFSLSDLAVKLSEVLKG